jgi:hypothetical protein
MHEDGMNKRLQLVILICAVTLISAIASHSIVAWLKIARTVEKHRLVGPDVAPSVFVAGSSLAWDGLSWERIGHTINQRVESWGVPGSSPSEWEPFQKLASQAKLTFIVVSPYDLNEYFLCDLHARVVTLLQTINDLKESRADWLFCKRQLGSYPLNYLRALFPTAGRSDGIMTGVREKFRDSIKTVVNLEAEAAPKLTMGQTNLNQEKISNWPADRMLRRLASMRNGCLGNHAFDGPKHLAFTRMLIKAHEKGRTVVVVLPVSPAYAKEFLSAEVMQQFERSLIKAQHGAPQTQWIRLDHLNELNSNEYFWDLVHMNRYGQEVATNAFLDQFMETKTLP